MLRGRKQQCEALDWLLAEVRAARSRALVVRCEPGIGKTALLGLCGRYRPRFQVARAAGVEAEMGLPFAALRQLCGPMLDRLDRLRGPLRDALGVAFGMSSGSVPGRFLIGDAQWLDQASAQPQAFVARMLDAEPVALLFSSRDLVAEGDLPGPAVEGTASR
jgi:hypothetical protein